MAKKAQTKFQTKFFVQKIQVFSALMSDFYEANVSWSGYSLEVRINLKVFQPFLIPERFFWKFLMWFE